MTAITGILPTTAEHSPSETEQILALLSELSPQNYRAALAGITLLRLGLAEDMSDQELCIRAREIADTFPESILQ